MIESSTIISGENVALHYDELDHFYRDVWGDHVHHGLWLTGREYPETAVRQLVEKIAALAFVQHGTSICDIGCGYGATARMLAEKYSAQVTGITISEAQYRYAIQVNNGVRNPVYLHADWFACNLPAESFDAAIAIESSEHMADKALFFFKTHHILKPGGRLVVCAWLAGEHPSSMAKKFLLEPICREGRMPNLGTESDLRRLMQATGFRIESFEDITKNVRHTWPVCGWRFINKLLRDPRYFRFLLNRHKRNRIFALTMARIWIAYLTGAMRYGIFLAVKS